MVEFRNLIELPTRKRNRCLDAMVPLRSCGLHAPTALRSMCADVLDINSRGNHFDIVQRELTALRNDMAIDGDHGTTVVVEPVTIASLLVGIEVNATELQFEVSDKCQI